MNAQDYISSGLLEAYVLGSLPLAESEQVAGAMCRFPEVAVEIAALEAVLIQNAEQEAIMPPPEMEDKIWAAIQLSAGAKLSSVAAVVEPAPIPKEKPAPVVIPVPAPRKSADFSWARAAVWLLLAGSLATSVYVWQGRKEDQQALASMEKKMATMAGEQQNLTAALDRYRREAEMASAMDMEPVVMRSTQPGHPMAATIYWNKSKSEAYVSVQKLPPAPQGMQYQLWAIADGKPVSIGMLDNEVAASGGMQKVPEVVAAGQAFAVSLEKAGGNASPTPDRIFLLGKMPA